MISHTFKQPTTLKYSELLAYCGRCSKFCISNKDLQVHQNCKELRDTFFVVKDETNPQWNRVVNDMKNNQQNPIIFDSKEVKGGIP